MKSKNPHSLIRPFKPYILPTASSSWKGPFNALEAEAFIRPRGGVWGVQIPKDAKRYQIFSYEMSFRIYDARGKAIGRGEQKPLIPVACRVPKNSVVEVYVSKDNVVVSDILHFFGQEIRALPYEQRMGAWWYMPQEFSKRVFFNETNFSKLNIELFQDGISKVLFKPDFVRYPTKSGAQVHNWLMMRKPKDVHAAAANTSKPSLRPIGPRYSPNRPRARG